MKFRSPLVILEQLQEAALLTRSFVEGMERTEFLRDVRTQHAVSMCLITIGEMVSRLERDHPDVIRRHPATPWPLIRSMRNRIAHGYFELNFDVVWDTAQTSVVELLYYLPVILTEARHGNDNQTSSI
jgi:uncharacterized protein with HEPN domain